jgi:hypothetical protein
MEKIIYKAQINSLVIKAEKESVGRSEERLFYDGIQIVEDPYNCDDLMIRIMHKDGSNLLASRFPKVCPNSELLQIKKAFEDSTKESYSMWHSSNNAIILVSPEYAKLIRFNLKMRIV